MQDVKYIVKRLVIYCIFRLFCCIFCENDGEYGRAACITVNICCCNGKRVNSRTSFNIWETDEGPCASAAPRDFDVCFRGNRLCTKGRVSWYTKGAAEKPDGREQRDIQTMKKILVGLSGGVDSAVAALLLKEKGYDVAGITLRTWESDAGEMSRCCEIDDARDTAARLGIPFHVVNCVGLFCEKVTKPFVAEYLRGRTPNPCVGCNRDVKWAKMLEYADITQADGVATGHYAKVVQLQNGRFTVHTAAHAEKDQTYMLYRLTQEQLRRTVMPLADMSKAEVRALAEAAGIPVADKPDSQEICFVPEGHYAEYVRDHAPEGCGIPGEGNFVDLDGRVLGRHKGIIHYTVGQRKGLGIALGFPAYVAEIRPAENEVVLGDESAVYRSSIFCEDVNFMGIPDIAAGESLRCFVKVRYHHTAQAATVTRFAGENTTTAEEDGAGGGLFRIAFDEPVRAAAPGQSAVWYDADGNVLGGGIISEKNTER